MKFSHSLQINSVPDWADHYINYSNLKKLIYQLEKVAVSQGVVTPTTTTEQQQQQQRQQQQQSHAVNISRDSSSNQLDQDESTIGLLSADNAAILDPNAMFSKALDSELEKIVSFYIKMEKELFDQVESLHSDVAFVERYEENVAKLGSMGESSNGAHADQSQQQPPPLRKRDSSSSGFRGRNVVANRINVNYTIDPDLIEDQGRRYHSGDEDDEQRQRQQSHQSDQQQEESPLLPQIVWSLKKFKTEKSKFKKQATELFVQLCELKEFVDLNYTGFSKILKKYDKVTGNDLKKWYLTNVVDVSYPCLPETKAKIEKVTEKVTNIYSRIATDGKYSLAMTELRSHLRDRIVWERNTIWRDMIEQERKVAAIGVRTRTGTEDVAAKYYTFRLLGYTFTLPIIQRQVFYFIGALIIFAILLSVKILDAPEQQNCLAMLVFAILLWAFEIIPLFVTSLVIPFLAITLRVMRQPIPDTNPPQFQRLDAKSAAKLVFSSMFSPVIMLLLGGFSLAAALSKHGIAKGLASILLSKASTKPHSVLLVNMSVACFASMWISNVAAPVLCFSLVQPLLRTLPHKSPYARCLIMGIALASNIGGMASPISSPQNLIALQNMNPAATWPEWLAVSVPLCSACILIVWAMLLVIYRPAQEQAISPPTLSAPSRGEVPGGVGTGEGVTGVFNNTQIFVLAVTGITIVLWCLESVLEDVLGDMGAIAILPIVLFFGTGVLTKDDFNNFLWTVIMLAMGGISLGKAVDSSGLLKHFTGLMVPYIQPLTVWQQFLIFTGCIGVITTFISHTVGALIILPIVAGVGNAVEGGVGNLLVMGSAFMCSAAMGLPVSSFPNMNAVSLEDPTGVPWLSALDFLKVGMAATAVAWVGIVTVGYWLLNMMGI